MKEIIHHDEDGKAYVLDEAGNRRPPMQSEIIKYDHVYGGWHEYDSSQGHCGLCGRLTCGGWCVQGGS